MINITNKKQCCGCYACANMCPNESISMKCDEEGFVYPEVNRESCINCGLCERVCPIQNSATIKKNIPETYAAFNINNDIREESSSGGIFTALAESVLKTGGAVFGVILSEDCRQAYHVAVESVDELIKLRGSKYLQSEVGNAYSQVKKLLNEGRKVLFTGTPCQVEGLKRYLGKEWDNLLTVDIICHGIPSPKAWQKYVEYREECADATTRNVKFRSKIKGWEKYSVFFEFVNDEIYVEWFNEDPFGKGFISNLFFRPACESCKFKKVSRESDITLADFWGIKNVIPQMDDDRGTSLVLVHSDKGLNALEMISTGLKMEKVDTLKALKGNPYVKESLKPSRYRKHFFANIENFNFADLIRKYGKRRKNVKEYVAIILKRLHLWKYVRMILGRS